MADNSENSFSLSLISITRDTSSVRIFSAFLGSVFAISRAMEKRVSAFLSFSSISLAIDRALSGSIFASSKAMADNSENSFSLSLISIPTDKASVRILSALFGSVFAICEAA